MLVVVVWGLGVVVADLALVVVEKDEASLVVCGADEDADGLSVGDLDVTDEP